MMMMGLKHPMLPVVFSLMAGIMLAGFSEAPLPVLFLAAFVAGLLRLLWTAARPWVLLVFAFLAGWVNLARREAALSPNDLRHIVGERPAQVTVRGTLTTSPSQRVVERDGEEFWHTLAPVRVTAIQFGTGPWRPAAGSIQTSTRGQVLTNLFLGQPVEVSGVLSYPAGAIADGLFDYRAYLRRLGIHYQLKAASSADWRTVGPTNPPPWTEHFRLWAQNALGRGLPAVDEPLKLQWAMVLGWKTALTGEVSEPFMRSGTMHIFAISGLHIALIAGMLVLLLRSATIPRSVCGIVILPIIWFYTAATEWQASAIRSTIMTSVIVAGWSLRRPANLVNSLAAAAFIILLWDPSQLFQAGFQLSFAAVLSIAVLEPPLNRLRVWLLSPTAHDCADSSWRWQLFHPLDLTPSAPLWAGAPVPSPDASARRLDHWLFSLRERIQRLLLVPDPLLLRERWTWWQRVIQNLQQWTARGGIVSLAATIGTAPLIAWYFHLFTPVSLLANLVVVPISGFALMSGLGGVICAGWFPGFAVLFNHAGWFFMWLMVKTSRMMADWPGAYSYVQAPRIPFLLLYYGILAAWLTGAFASQRRRWVIGGLALLACVWIGARWHEGTTSRLTVLPLRDGHAAWLDAPGSRNDWLLDCGDRQAVERVVVPFLRAQGADHVPNFLLTHGDVHHVGGATNLLDCFSVGQLHAPSVRFLSQPYRQFLGIWTNRHGGLMPANAGEARHPWTVLHPAAEDRLPQADDKALVLRGDLAGVRVLLCSDLSLRGQSALLERHPDLRADIVVAGLPSQGEPFHDAFLEVTQPRLVIIADDEAPHTARASPALRARLTRRGAPVLFLSDTRAATLDFRAGRCEVSTMSGARIAVCAAARPGPY